MRNLHLSSIFTVAVAVAASASASASGMKSTWVFTSPSGKLFYHTLAKGDRIADFSYAGYMAGGVPLPDALVVRTLKPSGKDDSAAIQRAIDEVSDLPLHNHLRGAVLLAPGVYLCGVPLNITATGVTLRGSGSSVSGSTLELTNKPHVAITIIGDEHIQIAGKPTHISERYVHSGARAIIVQNASSFKSGDRIRITRITTPEWLHLMGMDNLIRNGKPEIWVGSSITTDRTILRRKGNVLLLDVPLTDSYDRKYLPPEGAEVTRINAEGAIEQSGVEDLRIVAPARKVSLSDAHFGAIRLRDLHDGWVRNVHVENTTAGIGVGQGTRRITVQDVDFLHSVSIVGAAKPADFNADGTQILFLRCTSTGDNLFYVVTGARNQGPNVVLDCLFHGTGHIQPHQRWSTGFLVDRTHVPDGGIDLMNRGEMGSGHGWTMGWGVVWNSSAMTLIIQNPPGAVNWSIGNTGSQPLARMPTFGSNIKLPDLPQGIVESPDKAVTPSSLYRQQLRDRLGSKALRALSFKGEE